MLKGIGQGIIGLLVLLVILIVIVVGGWRAHWWFAAHNATNQAHLDRTNFSFQQTMREQITNKLADVDALTVAIDQHPGDVDQLTAQRRAVENVVCQDAEQIVGDSLPADQAQWVKDNCVLGSAK